MSLIDTADILDFPPHIMMVCFCHHILQNIKKIKSHLLQCMTINRMSNLAFGGHFGFSPPTHLAHVEEMEVLWIMA